VIYLVVVLSSNSLWLKHTHVVLHRPNREPQETKTTSLRRTYPVLWSTPSSMPIMSRVPIHKIILLSAGSEPSQYRLSESNTTLNARDDNNHPPTGTRHFYSSKRLPCDMNASNRSHVQLSMRGKIRFVRWSYCGDGYPRM
jgi:hypothetical protein